MAIKVATTKEEHYGLVDELIRRRPDNIRISTFGISNSPTMTRLIRGCIQVAPVKLLIGCRLSQPGDALDATTADLTVINWDEITPAIVDILRPEFSTKRFEVRMSFESHLKCWIFRFGSRYVSIVGGRNLTFSDWADISVQIGHHPTRAVARTFNQFWEGSATPPISSFVKSVVEENKPF